MGENSTIQKFLPRGKKGPKKKIQRSEEGQCHQRSRGSPPCCWPFAPSEILLPSLEHPPLPRVPPGCRGNGAASPGADGEEEGRVTVIPAVVAISRLGLAIQAPWSRETGGAQGPAPILNPLLAWHKDEGNPPTSARCVRLNKSLPFLLNRGARAQLLAGPRMRSGMAGESTRVRSSPPEGSRLPLNLLTQ